MKKLLLLLLLITSGVWSQNLPQLQFANTQTSTGFGGTIYINNSVKDASNNMYYIGIFYNTADFDPSTNEANLTSIGIYDTFIAKYDAQGNYLWAKNLGGTAGNIINGNITIGGNFLYITGSYTGTVDFDPSNNVSNLTSVSNSDIFLARYDLNGFYVLSKSIGETGEISVANDIKFLNNQIVITGSFTGTVDFDPSTNIYNLISSGSSDYFLAKYSSSFVLQWANNEGVSFAEEGKSIAFDSAGNILVAATKGFCSTKFDYWLGNVNIINTSNSVVTSSQSVTQTSNSCNRLLVPNLLNDEPDAANVIFDISFATTTGTDGSTGTNLINQYVTQKTIDGVLYNCYFYATGTYSIATGLVTLNYQYRAYDAATNVFAGYLRTGTITISLLNSISYYSPFIIYNKNTFIKKYTNNGVAIWSKNIGAASSGTANNYNKINLDSANNIFVTGSYNISSDFDPSTNTNALTPSGYNGFISKYDTNGNYLWAKNIGTTSTDRVVSSCLDSNGNLYIIGYFSATSIDMDPSATGTFTLNYSDGRFFFSAFDTNGNFISAKSCIGYYRSIVVDSNYDINLSGYFSGYGDLDATANTDYFYSENPNAFLSKYNFNGDYLFSKQLGNKPALSTTNFVGVDAQHKIYRAGSFGGTIDLDPSATTANIISTGNSSDIFIAKYNTSGGYIWGKTITGGLTKTISAMNADSNGNMYVTGTYSGTVDFDPSANAAELIADTTLTNLFIAKYDTNGNFQWVKTISGNISTPTEIVFDAIGNFYFKGDYYTDVFDIDPSPSNSIYLTPTGAPDTYFVKFNPQGNLIWAKSINGLDSNSFSYSGNIVVKGNYLYLTGQMNGTYAFDSSNSTINNLTTTSPDGFLAKYDLNGNYISASVLQDIDGAASSSSYSSFTVDSNDNVYLTTDFVGTYDLDPSPNSANYVTSDSNGLYAISKISANGSLAWVNIIPRNNYNFFSPKISVNSNNQLVVLANFGGALDFDSSANDFIVTASTNQNTESNTNIVLAKYNTTNGSFVAANKIDGQYEGYIESAVFDNNNDILMSGSLLGTADFDFSSSVQNLTSTSLVYSDFFYAKYNDVNLAIAENTVENNSLVLYPNPVSDILHIHHNELSTFEVKVLDITGKILDNSQFTNDKGIDVSSYPQGIYFVEVLDSATNIKSTYKFIKK
ncbi:Secretion system C-terminal sorting domain [Flavobacteriaceae bacterium]